MDFGSMIRPLEWLAIGVSLGALWISGVRQRRKLDSLARQIDEMRAENQRLERSARSVSHELMQPLGAITNYAEMIRLLSTGDVRTYASSILEVSAKTALRIRERGPKPQRDGTLEVVGAPADADAPGSSATVLTG